MTGAARVAGWTTVLVALLSVGGQLLWPLGLPDPAAPAPLPRLAPLPPRDQNPPAETVESAVAVDAPGGRLAGVVVEPVRPDPNRSALVLVPGGGDGRYADQLPMARALAAHGLTVLVHDKRTAGYTPVTRDYAALADDALAALALLRTWPGVVAERTGMAGLSEGGWVVPLAAAAAPGPAGPAFGVLIAGPVVTPGEQVQWLLDSGLVDQGAPRGAREAVAAAQATSLPFGLLGYTRHQPEPPLLGTRVPLLAVHGTRDTAIPVVDSIHRLLAATGPQTSVVVLDGAGHVMSLPDGELSPDFAPVVAGWIDGLPGTAIPPVDAVVRGAPPVQPLAATAQPADPLGGGALVLLGTVLVIGGAAAGPVARLVARRRSGPVAPVRRLTRWLGVGAVGEVLVVNLGLGGLAATAALGGGPLAAGGIWLVMRVSGVALAGLTVATVLAGRDGEKAGPATRVGTAGALVAGVSALVLAARAGLFVPRW